MLHFGLSYLYKLPYKHSIKDGIKDNHFDSRLDLAHSIFGYVDKKKALKGRVYFSHFKAISNIRELNPRTEILGTPRASYYPIYVRQYNTDFKTFMDGSFDIAGWKRYPIHKSKVKKTEDTENENVGTTFAPLDKGVLFKGKVRYHNLKKAEIGALLSALTFHNTKECYHNIGMAKPLGYGKIELKIKGLENIETYLKNFELEISKQIIDWRDSKQLKELVTMATEQNNSDNSKLEYMSLTKFADSKSKDKDYLRLYSELDNIKTTIVKSFISQSELDELKLENKLFLKQENERKEKIEEERKFQIKLTNLNYNDANALNSFIKDNSDYEKIDEIIAKRDDLEKSQQANKFLKVDESVKNAYKLLQGKKGNQKQYQKELSKFLKKWDKEKNNKNSPYILELVKSLRD